MPRDLIFSQCRVVHAIHGRLLKTCLTLVERLNPGVDLLLIDNASPLDVMSYLPSPDAWQRGELPYGGFWPGNAAVLSGQRNVCRFSEAIGHFNHGRNQQPPPKDGPGRAITTALSMAIASGYDRACYIEGDCLNFWPVARGFELLEADGTKVGFQPRLPVGYLDNNVWWFSDLAWLRNVGAIERYDWPNRKGDFTGEPTGELIWEEIFRGALSVLPMRGGRGSMRGFINGDDVRRQFPDGIDYLTHVERSGFCAALEIMGHGDLAPYLMGEG